MAAKIDRITGGGGDWFEEDDGGTEEQPEKDNAEARRTPRLAETERRAKAGVAVGDAKLEFSHNILGAFL
jgi:hypothetical protein